MCQEMNWVYSTARGTHMERISWLGTVPIIIIIIMTGRQSVATTLHDDRDPVPSSTPV